MSLTTGIATTVDGRPALRFERRLRHAPERVWRAVTEPAELAQWFVAPPTWTPALGEKMAAFGGSGEIVALDPPRHIAWTWGTARFSFDVEPDGDGTRLVFVHVLEEETSVAQTSAGWETYLDRLGAALAGTPLSEEDAHGAVGVYHEAHAAQSGDDPTRGRAFVAGLAFRDPVLLDGPPPELRIERLLPAPPGRVWAMLTEPDDLAHWFPGGADALTVVHADAPHALDATWFGEALRFELSAHSVGCRLVFTHRFAEREVAARTAAGWDRCLARFDARLAGTDLDEAASLVLWPVVHERLAEAYGVDPEIGRAAFAAHPAT